MNAQNRPIWQADHPASFRRRVKWGECDPAGVVYTPRFGDYVAEALHAFLEQLLGSPLQQRLRELDVGTPCKALSFVFHSSLWPDQEFDIRVRAAGVRTRSFDLAFDAYDLEDKAVFSAGLSAVCVHHAVRSSRALPAELRERLELYGARFPVLANDARFRATAP